MTEDKTYTLYGGDVELVFKPNSTKYRYTVTDRMVRDMQGASVRGVTSVLKDIIAKPDLMTWPMNMANAFLFGSTFDEVLKQYVCDWEKASLKPDTPFTEEELQNMMMDGSRQWTKRSDKGKDVGTLTHSAVEAYLRGVEFVWPEVDPEQDKEGAENVKMAQKALKAFTGWWDSLEDKEVIEVEKPIYSRSMKYAGTFDLMARINGKTYMLDIKTTNASKKAPLGIYSEYFLQLGGYSYAMKEETGQSSDDCGVIRIGKDGRLFIATANDIGLTVDGCERAFAFAVRLHDFLEQATPFLQDAHFKSHLIPTSQVDNEVSISN